MDQECGEQLRGSPTNLEALLAFQNNSSQRANTTNSSTLVEMTQRKDEPFGLIDECIFNMDGECEILTLLGVEESLVRGCTVY